MSKEGIELIFYHDAIQPPPRYNEKYDASVRAILSAMLSIPHGESDIVFAWLQKHNPRLASRLHSEFAIITRTPLDQEVPPEQSEEVY